MLDYHERRKLLNRLAYHKGNENGFWKELNDSKEDIFQDSNVIRRMIWYAPKDVKKNPKFNTYIQEGIKIFLKSLETTRTVVYFNTPHSYLYTNDPPRAIKACMPYFNIATRGEVIDGILNVHSHFYPYAKRTLATITVHLLRNDEYDKAISVLRTFQRNLTKSDFEKLINKIPNGLADEGVQNIISKSSKYKSLLYDKEKVADDFDEQVKILKEIAKTPGTLKRLSFNLDITLEHVKKLAPVMRFNFLQFVFGEEIRLMSWYGHGKSSNLKWYKERKGLDKINVPLIALEDMKDLLFAVSLKKNEQVSKWFNKYKKYYEAVKDANNKTKE